MELGLHIADFTWAGGAPALGPALARHVREAEAAGIRRISVMDHFWQIRGVGHVGVGEARDLKAQPGDRVRRRVHVVSSRSVGSSRSMPARSGRYSPAA